MKTGDKLYLVIRADLPPGPQAVQACHALAQFQVEFPEVAKLWYEQSNYLAFLAVPDEIALSRLLNRARKRFIPVVGFREPDLKESLTAIALAPDARGLVRKLPLALAG